MTICLLVNLFGPRYLNLINTLCVYWTGGMCLVVIIVVLVMSKEKRPAGFVFANFDTSRIGCQISLFYSF